MRFLRNNATRSICALLSVGALSAGCDTTDGGEAAPAVEVSGEALRMCTYDEFSVELTAGPDAGLTLAGKLFVVQRPEPGAFVGRFIVGDDAMPVHGQWLDDQVTLAVDTPDGFVTGVGPVATTICGAGEAGITGVAVGPAIADDSRLEGSDSGHWLLSRLRLSEVVVFTGDLLPLPGFEDPNDIIIRIPDSVISDCQSGSGGSQTSCLQNFCNAQQAGQLSADAATGALVCVN